MADQTDLVIAVDSSQVKAAAESLRALGFQVTAVEVSSEKLSKAVVDVGKAGQNAGQTGVGGIKNLAAETKKAAVEADKLSKMNLGNQVLRVDTSQIDKAVDALKTWGFQASSVNLNVGDCGSIREQLESIKEVRSTLADLQNISFSVRTDQILAGSTALRNLGFQATVAAGDATRLSTAVGKATAELQGLSNVPAAKLPTFDLK